jgi:hypothetical protein
MDGRDIPSSSGTVFSAAFWDAFWGSSEFIVLPSTLWYLKEVEVTSGCRRSPLSCLLVLNM